MQIENSATVVPHAADSNNIPHRGWGMMEQGGIALGVIATIAIVSALWFGLRSKTNVGTETSNIQTIITSAQNLLAGSDGYDFSSGAKMMGALIQMNAVPRTMRVGGDRTSGTATLYNTWGGEITLDTVTSNGFANGFKLTYDKVPQAECIQIATAISKSGIANGIAINSNSHDDGKVTTENASTQCTGDNSGSGSNKLAFTVNG
ncbi:type 4 pilus major pilin [Kluyvera cryocrescens]|uniref:Type 4 pilus major pilin n=1 Tax=Kluyvera cryocrescens TaxID=580 RepID=A0AAW9CFT2_KLUCR|nr:type 4 pilus major pilin [Kluyvera cryocrescens]MDW3779662.1 type 4 pilus major pilin [Kluyvera cryocrescens]MEB7558769.1 pilus assembly protein PilX [Kluyvera cryocrescens]